MILANSSNFADTARLPILKLINYWEETQTRLITLKPSNIITKDFQGLLRAPGTGPLGLRVRKLEPEQPVGAVYENVN